MGKCHGVRRQNVTNHDCVFIFVTWMMQHSIMQWVIIHELHILWDDLLLLHMWHVQHVRRYLWYCYIVWQLKDQNIPEATIGSIEWSNDSLWATYWLEWLLPPSLEGLLGLKQPIMSYLIEYKPHQNDILCAFTNVFKIHVCFKPSMYLLIKFKP